MSLHVFVSSTARDLEKDCRFGAIRGVKRGGALPVAMETWVAEYESATRVCRQKIRESSHYVGIIAYRRGTELPQLGKSITEAEFDWAQEDGKISIVLLPAGSSPFNASLKRRAHGQSEAEKAAQDAFRERIRQNGAYTLFEDAADLECKVCDQVRLWQSGGLRAMASEGLAGSRGGSASPGGGSSLEQIASLGRVRHVNRLVETLDVLESRDPKAACLVIHGPNGSGHAELLVRLRRTLALARTGEAEPYRLVADLGASWRENSLGRLVEMLAPREAQTPQELASELSDLLRVGDVILELGNAQRFPGGLPELVERLWRPLASSLAPRLPNRLVVLLSVECKLPTSWKPYLQENPKRFDPLCPIKLPHMSAFTREELRNWLTGKLPDDRIDPVAAVLMDETGGDPQSLYNKLRDNATWL